MIFNQWCVIQYQICLDVGRLSSAIEVLEDLLGAVEFASFGKVAYKLKSVVTEFSTLLLVLLNSLTDTLILDVLLVILTLKSKTSTELAEAVV